MVRRQVLHHQHKALKVPLLHQLSAPMQQEGGTHVQLELREPIRLGQVRVPQADRAVQRQFACQQIVHPPEGELQVVDAVLDEVFMQLQVDPLD